MGNATMWDDYEYQRSRANRFRNQAISDGADASRAAMEKAVAHHGETSQLLRERDQARQALVESRALVAEWQAAMEAWRDLAQTLRDEIKACPNHEAHRFGKDKEAVNQRLTKVVNEGRTKRGLKPFQDN